VLFAALTNAKAQTNNTIYACYDKTNGNLRKVNSPAACRASEIAGESASSLPVKNGAVQPQPERDKTDE
jgi:hypothetical protein